MGFAIKIGDRLLKQGAFNAETLEEALVRQKKAGGRLGTQLLDMGVVSRYTLTNLLNRQHGLPLLRVADDIHVKGNAVAAFPRAMAQRYRIVPIANQAQVFVVGAIDPPPLQVLKEIEVMVRKPLRVTILPEAIFYQMQRDVLQIPTDFFANHLDPKKVEERPFQEGHKQKEPRDLIVFEVAGITLAWVRQKKGSTAHRLGDMLIEDGLLTQEELDDCLKRHPGMHVGEALVEDDLLDARLLSRYLSRHYKCATIDPYAPMKIDKEMLKLVQPGTARKYLLLPLAIYEKNLLLLTPEPDNEKLLMVVANESGHQVKPVVTPRACAHWFVENFYAEKKPVKRPV
jgi:hypothetical protein